MLFEVWELFGEIQRSTVLLLKCVNSISFFPNSSVGQETFCNAGDSGLIPGLGRSPEEGNGNPLQSSCLGNCMDREAWWATVHEVSKEMDATERLNNDNDAANVLL